MIYHVFANRSNVGDWLSARGIQSLLGGGPYVELLCDEPFVPETIEALSVAGPDDFVIIGGGGLFMNYFIPFWKSFEPLSKRLRFALWGVGYCDLKNKPSCAPRDLLSSIVTRSRLCVVRDELSRRLLGLDNLPKSVPCPSLNVVEPVPAGFGMLHVDNFDAIGESVYEAMDAVGRGFAERTGRIYRTTNNRISKGNEALFARCLDIYAKSDIVLSSALHGCIISVAMGKKILAVSGDRKIDAFMEAAGLGDWVLDALDNKTIDQMLVRLDEQPRVDNFVRSAREANRSVAECLRGEIARH